MAESTKSDKQLSVDHGEKNEEADSVRDAGPAVRMNKWARQLCILGVLCAVFLFALDNTIVAVVQSRLIQEFNEIQKLPWISVGYQLGSTTFNLLWGKMYLNFEHKNTFICGLLLFEIGSAVCGAAPSMNALIVGRIICGIGGNGIYGGAINIISNLTTIQERPVYMGYFGMVWGAGTVLGPIVGGGLTSSSNSGWRWCFYLNLCVAAVFAPVYLFLMPRFHPQKGKTIRERVQGIDYVGATLFAGAAVTGVVGLSFGGALYSWSSASTIVPLCLSVVLWIAFVIQQRYAIFVATPDHRIFPVHLITWENSVFFAQVASASSSQLVPIYYIPLYFQFVHDSSAIGAGVHALPLICCGVFFTLLNGAFMAKTGYYMPWFLGGSICVLVGAALMSTVGVHTAYGTIYGFSALLGIGVGAYTQASFAVLQAKHSVQESPNVVAFLICAQKFGLTLGFCVANSVFINLAANRIDGILPGSSRAQVQAAVAGGTASLFAALSASQRQSVLAAIARTFDDVYYQVVGNGALSLVLSIFLKRERLFRPKPVSEA